MLCTYICICLHITWVLICCCCLHRNLLMVRYVGFLKISWYMKLLQKCVCWGDGGNCSSIYTQVLKFKSRTYQILTVWTFHVYFVLFHQKKKVQRNGYIIDRYGNYMLSCLVGKKIMTNFVTLCNYELINQCLLDPFFMQFIECLRTLLTF